MHIVRLTMAPMREYRFSNNARNTSRMSVCNRLVEELESQVKSLEKKHVKQTEKNHELEDSLVVFSEDIKKLYKKNTTLAVEIHKIHKFLYTFTKRVGVRFQLIESTIEEITCKMQNLSLK